MDEGGGGVPSGGAPIPSLAWPPEPMGDPASGDEDSLLGSDRLATIDQITINVVFTVV
jgi:hypothetical protein